MNIHIKIVLYLLVIAGYAGWSQQSGSLMDSKNLLPGIIEAYNDFDYDKSSSLLKLAEQNIHTFTLDEKMVIYQYGAFLAFNKGNTTQTGHYFWQILEIDPTFSLDPVTTPPKLLAIFQKTSVEFQEDLNRRSQMMVGAKPSIPFPWRAVFPGWEQWHRGYSGKRYGSECFCRRNAGGNHRVCHTDAREGRSLSDVPGSQSDRDAVR